MNMFSFHNQPNAFQWMYVSDFVNCLKASPKKQWKNFRGKTIYISAMLSKLMENVLICSALVCTQTHMDFLSISQEFMLSYYFDLSFASQSCSTDVSKSKASQFRDLKLYEKWVSGTSPETVRWNASTKYCDLERHDSWVLLEWTV